MIKTIEVIILATGQSRMETKGFNGSDCQAASQFLEAALGSKQSEQFTAEFHQSANAQAEIAANRSTRL
jgi:hypothetical protein